MKNFVKTGIYFRWVARIVSVLTVLIFVIFLIGEGLPTLSPLSSAEINMFICLFIALLGILVSLRWSLVGCLMMIAGYVGFVITDKHFTLLSPFSLFLVIVVFYVLAWFLDRNKIAS